MTIVMEMRRFIIKLPFVCKREELNVDNLGSIPTSKESTARFVAPMCPGYIGITSYQKRYSTIVYII